LTVEHLDAATCIGLLSSTASHEELREKLSARFERLGRPLIQVASRRFERPAISFALTVLKSSSEAETLPPCYSI
jgi:signal-transduction protein with cAMP-binding, CBS, and nucleotidyltransferase domain